MSMPSIHLDCEVCNHHSSSSITWGDYKYQIDTDLISIDRRLGWCFVCDTFVPIESFEPEDYLKEIHELQKSIEKLENNLILSFLSSRRKKDSKYFKEQINKNILSLYIAAKRIGTEKCLTCGSQETELFNGDYSLSYENGNYQGSKRTGFKHPGCGGEFIATPNPIRYHMRFTPQLYDINGYRVNGS